MTSSNTGSSHEASVGTSSSSALVVRRDPALTLHSVSVTPGAGGQSVARLVRLRFGRTLAAGAAVAATVAAAAFSLAAVAAATGASGITGGDKITSFAGHAKFGLGGFSGDGGPATKAELSGPTGVAVDGQGNVYIADTRNQRVRKVNSSGTITTFAGGGPGINGPSGRATDAFLNNPTGVAVDGQGNVYIADSYRVYQVTPGGTLTLFAGTGGNGFSGDGGPATAAEVQPYGLAVDRQGNLYIADNGNRRVRKVNPAGTITTIAGNGTSGNAGDGGLATKAQLHNPLGVALDQHGNLYIVDQFGGRVRKVNPAGTITTIAGNGGVDTGGDGGPATKAPLHNPFGVAVDAGGNVYISELDVRVRKVTPGGTITTVVGPTGQRLNQTSKGPGDGGPAILAYLQHPIAMAFDRQGNLYIADTADSAVRKVWYGTAAKKTTRPRASKRGSQKAVLSLTNTLEIDLAAMARGRTQLKLALAGVSNCSLSARVAATRVAAVAAGRRRILTQLLKLNTPTAQTTRIKSLLRSALSHSLAADLHYRDWLAHQDARCGTTRTADLAAAQSEDRMATIAKRSFVAAFNPLARQLHLRTWPADML
jgi:sugar lactone lactonase YvrE